MKYELLVGDAKDKLKELKDCSVDLTVTSPPYDNLRTYKGYKFDFEEIAAELYRVTKDGGVLVWVVNDATIKGSETGTSFKQALYFMEVGFNLHDTMIYGKKNPLPNAGVRYQQSFEYMFVFSKGKPRIVNLLLRKRRNKTGDKRTYRKKAFSRDKDGNFNQNEYYVKEYVPRENIWFYYVGGGNSTKDMEAFKHPAIFPEELAKDHILTWTKEEDIVLDPFAGSGTTGKMALLHNRKFIGIEISDEYAKLARNRIDKYVDDIDNNKS